ncbi:hypothetical protein BC829DRAFT_384382 [Chytridium lagenaria]|nr:hypothetical protein BC829DRAFT_384382 [Chytridium lagenaria]
MAQHLASIGMQVILVDRDESTLVSTVTHIKSLHPQTKLSHHVLDVTSSAEFEALAKQYPTIHFLMNNAGTGVGGPISVTPLDAFLPNIAASMDPAVIVTVGSKQGITCHQGIYLKVFSEGLQHEVRNDERMKGRVTTHLLVPGWTNTGFFVNLMKETKPDADLASRHFRGKSSYRGLDAQTSCRFALAAIRENSFYIICPDNEKRIMWAAGDVVNNRSPLSRWDPQYAEEFKAFTPDHVA